MELSKGATAAIVAVVVIVVVVVGYMVFLKPKNAMSNEARDKYMQMMKNGGTSGGMRSGGMSGGMSGGR